MVERNFAPTAVLLVGLLMAGCSGGGTLARAKVQKVSGKVTFVGAPLIGAIVTFAPQDNQPAAVGRTNDAGEFTLTTYEAGDGAAPGTFKVMVMLTDIADESSQDAAHGGTQPGWVPPGGSHSAKSGKKGNLLPTIYRDVAQTPLTAKVEPKGDNKFTFDLK